ncbi:MAG: hypothetical protein ACREMX_05050, partial [Gemmatimonadales bacterium]
MSGRGSARLAEALLRLVLEEEDGIAPLGAVEWTGIARIGIRNAVLIRCTDRLSGRGAEPPPATADLVRRERERARAMLDAMQAVATQCRALGVGFLYPRALQHLPDMGRDLDLLLLSCSTEVDARLRAELHAVPLPAGLRGRIGGSTSYRLPGCPAVLDVQHGRLGVVGEHKTFPAALLRRRRPRTVAGRTFDVPSEEDQLLLQGMLRVYGRTALRLSDIASTILLLRSHSVDWDYVIRTARELAILPGLSCYLTYVDQIHAGALGGRLPCPDVARRLLSQSWGRVRFEGDEYRFPAAAVNCRLYLQRLATDLRSRRWSSAGRLGLIPAVAGAALCGRA